MTSNPSLSWQKIHDVYYSLRPCYDTLNWSIGNLYADYKVKVSTYTTLVALSSKYAPYPSVIDVYTVSGNKLWSIVYNSTPVEHIINYEFLNEDLFVIMSNQKYRHYKDLRGNFDEYIYSKDLISLDNFGESNPLNGPIKAEVSGKNSDNNSEESPIPSKYVITNLENDEPEEVFHVLNSYIWGNYLFLHLTNRFIISDLTSNKNYEVSFAEVASSKINCISLLKIVDNIMSVVISYSNTVLTMKLDFSTTSYEILDHSLTDGPFSKITASPNGQLVALSKESLRTIFVINNNFSQVLLEYDTSNDSSLPYQVEWCGNDAIVLSLRDEIKLLGPNQASISLFYDQFDDEDLDFDMVLKGNGSDELSFTIPFLKTEPDGLKVLTTKKLEFLSRVSEPTRLLYQIGSSHPSTILLDCIDKLSQQASKADTNISLLKADNALCDAMNSCLDAALDEFNTFWQKKILLCVSFGKAYVEVFQDSEKYLKVINTLKVLNQLRGSDIALFFSFTEAEIIGWETIINMLLNRDQYLLCLKIISLLDLQYLKDKIYIHWCCYKIKKEIDMADIDLFKIISKKLLSARDSVVKGNCNYLSVSDISESAYEEGRIDLCNMLINLEPKMVSKIEQYLRFDKLEIALIKSFESGEYDLSRLLLLHLHNSLSISQFFKILHQNESKTIKEPELENLDISSNKSLYVSGELVEHFWIESIAKNDSSLLEKYYKEEDMTVELNLEILKNFIKETKNVKSYSSEMDYYEDYRQHLLRLSSYSGDTQNSKHYQVELDVLNLRKKLTETYQTSFFECKTLNDVLIKLITMNQLKQAHKVVKEYKLTTAKLWYLILQTYSKLKEFNRLYQFILSSSSDKNNLKSPIGFQIIVETCLAFHGPPDQISIYINNCTDIHYLDKIQMFISNNDLVSAAQEAYRYKDIEFLKKIMDKANKHANDSVIQTIKSLLSKLE